MRIKNGLITTQRDTEKLRRKELRKKLYRPRKPMFRYLT